MTDFTNNIASFYKNHKLNELPYPYSERKFLLYTNKIAQKFNIQYTNAFITNYNQLMCWLSQHKLKLTFALTNPGCLQEIKKLSIAKQNTTINFGILPFYFEFDLKKLQAPAFIFPISSNKHLIFSNLPFPYEKPDQFDTLTLVYYEQSLNITKNQESIAKLKSTFDRQFTNLITTCKNLNKAYFFTAIDAGSTSNAQKIQHSLYIENILVSTHKNLVQIIFKPWHNRSHIEQLSHFLTKILRKLGLID